MVSRPVRTGEPTSALTRSPGPQGDEGPPSGSREGTVITDVVGGVHPPHMPQEADTLTTSYTGRSSILQRTEKGIPSNQWLRRGLHEICLMLSP